MIALVVFLSTCITAAICRLDYVTEVNQRQDVVESRSKAVRWLITQRNKDWGWGTKEFRETHRAMTALYLLSEMQNETESLEYQLSVRQLELELSLALLRSENKISAGQLALYANALLATCENPNDFYGHNIVKTMRPQEKLSTYDEALVSLAVTNSGNLLNKTELIHYFDLLDNHSQPHAIPDTKAMVILALSSAMKSYRRHRFIEAHLRQPLKSFKKSQKVDGSFGNIYSSALVMQALIGAGDKGDGWNLQKSLDYLLSQQKEDGSFGDLLATYFVLPVLAGRSLVSLRSVNCNTKNKFIEDTDEEDKLWNETISVRYSLWEETNISNVFDVPENSTFIDLMTIAQEEDDRYRFSGTEYSWGFYVQRIGNLSNDAICSLYWMLYKVNRNTPELVQAENGVIKEIPQDGDHYVFQYMKVPTISSESAVTCEDNQMDNNGKTTTTENHMDNNDTTLTTENSIDNI